jgi:PAS domain S-box-containing protein
LALAAVSVAWVARWLLDPVLHNYYPFFTFYFAVLLTAWLGGLRPGLVSLVLGCLVGDYFFADPRYSLVFRGIPEQLGALRYLFVGLGICCVSESMHRQRRRAQSRGELLWTTLASIGDAVIATDTEARISYMNAVAETVTGWTQADAMGHPLDAVFRIVNEETLLPVENPAIRSLRTGLIVGLSNHTLLIRKDGTHCPIDDSASPIKDEEGRVSGCVLIFRDITKRRMDERKQADAATRIRSIVDHSVDGIITIAENGVVESFNPAAEKLFGYSAAEIIGQNVKMLMPEPFHGEHDGYLADYVRTGVAKIIGTGREVEGRRKDGSTFPMDLAVSEFRLADTRYFSGIVRNISERKEHEKRIYGLMADLRETHRRKDEFLATLAHELRGPLAPLRNMLEIMKRAEGDGATIRQARDTMERQLGHLVRMVDDLMDMNRITRNKLDLRRERTELVSVLNQAVDDCRTLAESANLEVNVNVPARPIYLDADPVRLTQVFGNLLHNACKYTDPGGRIDVIGECHGGAVTVSVKDTGKGIPADQLQRVFELFTQVDRSLERSQGGLGIGLTLVKRLVEMHGGSIEARSEGLGKGSEFVVHLPVLTGSSRPKTPEPAEMPNLPRRILVVDDNRDSASSLAMLLKITGNEIHTAYDGLEALQAAERFLPEVILLDVGLPKLNGHDVCRRIRQQPWGKNMVVVALTGWGQDEDRRKSREAGFDCHMVKPVDYDDLMKVLAGSETATN